MKELSHYEEHCPECWGKYNKNVKLIPYDSWNPTPSFENIIYCPVCKEKYAEKNKKWEENK